MDDGVDHGVQRQVLGQRERAGALGVAQQHVQELVADHGLHVGLGGAVLAQEVRVHQQPGSIATAHRECRHLRGEHDIEDLQQRAAGEGILVDELGHEGAEPRFADLHA